MFCGCDSNTVFPDLDVYIENVKYTIPSSDYVKQYGQEMETLGQC